MIEVKEYIDGTAVINDGLSINRNGDVIIGKDLEVDGDITVNGNLNGIVKKISAPESTTLTDEQIKDITDGVFLEGNFLGYVNPIMGPALFYGGEEGKDYAKGAVIAGGGIIGGYLITMATKVITATGPTSPIVQINSVSTINGSKYYVIPTVPASGTHVLKAVNGTLTWVAEE